MGRKIVIVFIDNIPDGKKIAASVNYNVSFLPPIGSKIPFKGKDYTISEIYLEPVHCLGEKHESIDYYVQAKG